MRKTALTKKRGTERAAPNDEDTVTPEVERIERLGHC
jgi:hypothetical protein